MACGTVGPGRLSDPDHIVKAGLEILRGKNSTETDDLSGEHFLITAGATREEIDPVRFISNRSSGRMGFAIANAARRRGAEVTLVAGPTMVQPPEGVRLIRVFSAEQMAEAVGQESAKATVFVGTAAVADYKPAQRAAEKIKKTEDSITLVLERTPDILAQVSANRKNGMIVVGFAAETENLINNARQKLTSKNLDAIVANDVSRTDSGFDADNNAITILTRNNTTPVELPLMSKAEAAERILDVIIDLRATTARAKQA
jgi:phosphopantothenoylcysteine decarboxylase/phosphopantothenate--cysteine ligase